MKNNTINLQDFNDAIDEYEKQKADLAAQYTKKLGERTNDEFLADLNQLIAEHTKPSIFNLIGQLVKTGFVSLNTASIDILNNTFMPSYPGIATRAQADDKVFSSDEMQSFKEITAWIIASIDDPLIADSGSQITFKKLITDDAPTPVVKVMAADKELDYKVQPATDQSLFVINLDGVIDKSHPVSINFDDDNTWVISCGLKSH